MTDTATSRLGARQQSQGSNTNTWGDDKLNEVLRLIDRAMHGVESLAMTGDTTLSWTSYIATNTGQVAFLTLTGSLSSAANLIVPSVQWCWRGISNTTGQTITVKTSAGTGVAIPNNRQVSVRCDGSDCYYAGGNYIGTDITEANSRDLMDYNAVQTAIANAVIPAAAGTILNSGTDPSAGYLSQKVAGFGAVTASSTAVGTVNEKTIITVSDVALADGGTQSSSFNAAVGFFYNVPAGGTITLPSATGSRRKIGLSIFGAAGSTLSGTTNGTTSAFVDGDQTILITDSDVTRGWV